MAKNQRNTVNAGREQMPIVDLRQKLWAVATTHHITFEGAPGNELMKLSVNLKADLGAVLLDKNNLNSYTKPVKTAKPLGSNKDGVNEALIKFIKAAIPAIHDISDADVRQHSFAKLFEKTELVSQFAAYQKENTKADATMDDMFLIHLDPNQINPGNVEGQSQIDQCLMYHSPAAVEAWNKLGADPNYGLYKSCKENLEKILNTDEWKNSVHKIGKLFILGAGAATKDMEIIRSLATRASPVDVIWVDVSLCMLADTVKKLQEKIPSSGIHARGIATNFEDPARLKKIIEKLGINNEGITATFILGSTVSNIGEREFYRRFSDTSYPGDLLTISVEFIPEDQGEAEYKQLLKTRYESEYAKRVARAAFSLIPTATLDATTVSVPTETHDDIGSHFQVKAITKVKYKDGSEKSVVTFTASRYRRDAYLKLLEKYHWNLVEEKPANEVKSVKEVKQAIETPQPKVSTWLLRYNPPNMTT